MRNEQLSIIILSFIFFCAASCSNSAPTSATSQTHQDETRVNAPENTTDGAFIYESEQGRLLSEIQSNSSSADGSVTTEFHPWSYEPVCTEFLEGLDNQLCVYTNATFSNGRGVSIFTTPQIAEEFAALLPFQDPSVLSDHGINSPDRPWYTRELPGKGLGVLAKHQMKRGDLIAAYTPYLLAHMENVLSTPEREKYLRLAVDQLPATSREQYFSLATIYGEPSVIVQDVVKANAFEMQVGGQMHLAVFPETSRMNHACGPNAQYYLEPSLLTHYVHAARDIFEDEEITISYSPPLQFHAARRQYLKDSFHFTCTCPRCQNGELSDRAVNDIHALQWSLGNWESNSTASVKKAEMLVRLYKEEGLDAFLDVAYGHAALTYNAVGSARGAMKYAKLSVEAALLKYGPSAPDLEIWNELIRNPRGHSSWRRRKNN
ncbi:uncharacterized protein Z518_10845 [Rhinocladiella mackenziei CBS 650.93]|uniref:Rhinocladiella mackenziei CBS 650.93 unplaced genomic scaffold supercont1.10, whole genome shotgun sequence n=1 Tax=Rhinocladiella mackenziei CBS 650.93 TaxID=1442369 RepID=A0A0D2GNH6_9EURO|nr:uncharacterized protein Z518_10845 [Rhinocladiella mackenziei CBS 650.93]KIW99917.1 hypothetical protein Z518_10845 [Rhinocladiella mackenziei CBS 650.93]